MYPTRIPYEESSVFSSVNILDPDFKMHSLFKVHHFLSILKKLCLNVFYLFEHHMILTVNTKSNDVYSLMNRMTVLYIFMKAI